ncbi:asparagine synthase (glutamine-hydrolyzing) [Burkholderia sp. AU28863]|uniref:asparagine synthase (glutamine-hydrolyzing) n=1 Tax=Burkholderia sp. AU28863 TaxID=2015352 RepID=UPI000B7A9B57|nr:asparagine synthase (glutamine-hydrolyzing) [Burkholderia sp. AU28863]OXI64323.1 asparagine synthase (glutamine-hydrolyzing) [Burkholderia sp. AU28863]
MDHAVARPRSTGRDRLMCGLAGLIRYDGQAPAQVERVLAMRERQRHRGPDGRGLWHDQHALLAHDRLALLDAEHGAQPMRSADHRYVLVYNGEVYNYAELRRELSARWSFHTNTDTEVVLAAYAVWGEACLRRFNGMFAFLVWDTRRQRAFAARDRLGVKPFVYLQQGAEFLFASEAKGLLPAMHAPRANTDAVLEYLVAPFFSGVAQPMFEGMAYLPPGHLLRLDRDGLQLSRWAPEIAENPAARADDIAPALRERLAAAVQRSSIADTPVGLFLSGGLDSTLIGGLARAAGTTPPCFTIRFEDHDRYDYARSLIVASDDQPFAEQAANELGLPREDVAPTRSALAQDLLQLATQNDALPAWEQELAQHYLARAASTRLKAVLVGDAADETHYGYHFLLDPHATRDPTHILQRLTGDPYLRPGLLERPLQHYGEAYRQLAIAAGHDWHTPASRLRATQWLVRHRWLQRLLHNGDIHGMAHGLEARVPFSDTEVLDLAATIPAELALRDGVEKAMLREASRGALPEAVRLRRKSALPKDQGNGESLRHHTREILATDADRIAGLLDVRRLQRRCADPLPLNEQERAVMFRACSLAHWSRVHGVSMP